MVTVPVNVGDAKFAFKLPAAATKPVVAIAKLLSPGDCVTAVAPVAKVGVKPKDNNEEAVTLGANVVPVTVPAAAVTVIAALPSKATPLIALGVVSVAADPVVLWFNVGKSAATAVVNAPVPVVVFTIPVAKAAVPAL